MSAESGTIRVTIKPLTKGLQCDVDVHPCDTIRILKQKLRLKHPDFPPSKLYLDGVALRDSVTVQAAGISASVFLAAIPVAKKLGTSQHTFISQPKPQLQRVPDDNRATTDSHTLQQPCQLDTLLPGYALRPNPTPEKRTHVGTNAAPNQPPQHVDMATGTGPSCSPAPQQPQQARRSLLAALTSDPSTIAGGTRPSVPAVVEPAHHTTGTTAGPAIAAPATPSVPVPFGTLQSTPQVDNHLSRCTQAAAHLPDSVAAAPAPGACHAPGAVQQPASHPSKSQPVESGIELWRGLLTAVLVGVGGGGGDQGPANTQRQRRGGRARKANKQGDPAGHAEKETQQPTSRQRKRRQPGATRPKAATAQPGPGATDNGHGAEAAAPCKKRRVDRSKIADGPAGSGEQCQLGEETYGLSMEQLAVLVMLPLPAPLQRLLSVFDAVNAAYSFALRHHIQATWGNSRAMIQQLAGSLTVTAEDLVAMAELCPAVVRLKDTAGPRLHPPACLPCDPHARHQPCGAGCAGDTATEGGFIASDGCDENTAAAAAQSAGTPMMGRSMAAGGSGGSLFTSLAARGWSQQVAARVSAVRWESSLVDESGVLQQGDADTFIIELIDSGSRVAAAHIQQVLGLVGGQGAGEGQEAGWASAGLGNKVASVKLQSERAAKTAVQRRRRAFQQGLAVATWRLHHHFCVQPAAEGADEGTGTAGDWDPVKERSWHPKFLAADLSLQQIMTTLTTQPDPSKAQDTPGVHPRAPLRSPSRPPREQKKFPPCFDTRLLGPEAFLEHLLQRPSYKGQVVHVEDIAARAPCYAEPRAPLSDAVHAALASRGVSRLFSHQAAAVDALLSGRHIVVATSTASGKSLCYNIPMLEALVQDPSACAIYMFPTKALAQDQLLALRGLCAAAFGERAPCVEVYDGDTPQNERAGIRNRAQLLITNPDMLHQSILPIHSEFARLLSKIRYVVVDEGHAYKGVFGCHTALLLRRLRRVCLRVYNCSPRFVVTSATIANPREHAEALVGLSGFELVKEDGSPHGPKQFALWNPSLMFKAPVSGGMSKTEARISGRMTRRMEAEMQRVLLREANSSRARGSQPAAVGAAPQAYLQAAAGLASIRTQLKEALFSPKRKLSQLARSPPPPNVPSTMDMAAPAAAGSADPAASAAANGPGMCLLAADAAAAISAVGTDYLDARKVRAPEARSRPLMPCTVRGVATGRQPTALVDSQLQAEIDRNLPGRDWQERYGPAGTMAEQARKSPLVDIAMLLAEAVQHGLRTIAFCKSRKCCELVLAYTRETLKETAPHLSDNLKVYRAGYSPADRREIESELHSGKLLAVAATNALELGVDIGSLDCTLHLGFPGSVSSLWQQAGRAGRREQSSLSIYVAFDGPLDQYFMNHPPELFQRSIESAQVDASNSHVVQMHVMCAAAELPLVAGEEEAFFGSQVHGAISSLVAAGTLARHPSRPGCTVLHYVGMRDCPAADISLRAIDNERYTILNEADGSVLEEVEASKVFFQVYDGAVYMFQGRPYLCKRLDLDSKVALVRPVDVRYYTKLRDCKDVHIIGGRLAYPASRSLNPALFPPTSAACESAIITVRFLGFHRVWQGSGQVFDTVDLFLPDFQFETQAAHVRVPGSAREECVQRGISFVEGMHAASHAVLNVLPFYMMCNPTDMGTECDNPYATRYRPERVLIYDKHPGGIGLAAVAAPMFGALLAHAERLVAGCPCEGERGCPSCVQHLDCRNYNAVLSKEAGLVVLRHLLRAEQDAAQRRADRDAVAQPLAGFAVPPDLAGEDDMNNNAAFE